MLFDFSPCCIKRIGELTLKARELSKLENMGVEVTMSGECGVWHLVEIQYLTLDVGG